MRVSFLVDGFNLYHSLALASGDGVGCKWLDVGALCRSVLPDLHRSARLGSVTFFTASPNHVEVRSPGAVARHRDYVSALGARGVAVELGRFKARQRRCPHCHEAFESHEEKETEVAIAVRMMSMLRQSECDAMVLITADGDLAPAIREASRCFSAVPIYCGFPFGRGSHDLRAVATRVIRLRRDRYSAHQLPDLIVLPDGGVVRRPPAW
ncbi:MAG: NYN domain-containing protein [Candidatus Eisenbacteria bacterium]|nr:NYN domain-containing protein [Candidatus Eisenbacteria bacterium]